jgi:hypothetical protein
VLLGLHLSPTPTMRELRLGLRRHVTEPSDRFGPRPSAIGYVAKGWVAAFRRNDTSLRQRLDDIE